MRLKHFISLSGIKGADLPYFQTGVQVQVDGWRMRLI